MGDDMYLVAAEVTARSTVDAVRRDQLAVAREDRFG
jgi:hypothetical protein